MTDGPYVDVLAMRTGCLRLFILDDQHRAVEEPDHLAWGAWMHADNRHVLAHRSDDGWYVSTIFMGVDVRLLPNELLGLPPAPPMLFETMAFAPDRSIQMQERGATWDAAVRQHAEVCRRVAARGVTLREVSR